jgi:hypothetical protein
MLFRKRIEPPIVPRIIMDAETVYYMYAGLAMHALIARGEKNTTNISRQAYDIAMAMVNENDLRRKAESKGVVKHDETGHG